MRGTTEEGHFLASQFPVKRNHHLVARGFVSLKVSWRPRHYLSSVLPEGKGAHTHLGMFTQGNPVPLGTLSYGFSPSFPQHQAEISEYL